MPARQIMGIFALFILFSAKEVFAGAWTQAPGRGLIISTTGRQMAPSGTFLGGASGNDTTRSQLYAEYGLHDGLSLGATVLGAFSSTNSQDFKFQIGLFARQRLWSGSQGDVVSVQIGTSMPVERWVSHKLAQSLPDSVPEAYGQILYGRSWQTDWGNSFATGGGGFQWRGEHASDELRAELTMGLAPTKRWLALFNVYGSLPLGHGEAGLTFAPSVAYTLWPWVGENEKKPEGRLFPQTIQIGFGYDVLSRKDGLGVQISLWQRF